MSKRPLVFLDTEATGLGSQRRIWEVAMIRREPNGAEQSDSFFLPIHASRAEPRALDVGDFYGRHPQGVAVAAGVGPMVGLMTTSAEIEPRINRPLGKMKSAEQAAAVIARWTFGTTLVVASTDYDGEMLKRLLAAHGYEARWKAVSDVLSMARCHTGDEDLGGLDAVCRALDVTVSGAARHTAMGDARLTRAVYDLCIAGDPQIRDLVAHAQHETRRAVDYPPAADAPHGEVIEVTPATLAAVARHKANIARVRKAVGR